MNRWIQNGPPNYFALNRASLQARGLIHWWPVAGSRGSQLALRDFSGFGGDAIFPGGADNPDWSSDLRGPALDFSGNVDYAILPNFSEGRSEITLTMWIRPDEWASINAIVDAYFGVNTWNYSIYEGVWYTRDTSTGPSGARNNDLSFSAVNVGEWHHLVFVYSVSGSIKAVYQDGLLDASTSTSVDQLNSGLTATHLGLASDGDDYDGLMDDIRVYDRALSAAEIYQIFRSPWELYQPFSRLGVGRTPDITPIVKEVNEVVDIKKVWQSNFASGESYIYSLAVYDGDLYAGSGANGKIFKLDGATWSEIHDTTETSIYSLAVYDGDLYAGSGNNGKVFKFDGVTWSTSFPGELFRSGIINALAVYDGNLYAAGTISTDAKIFRYNGSTWSLSFEITSDSNLTTFRSLAVYDGDLYAGSGNNSGKVFRYNGSSWSLNYTSTEDRIYSLAVYGDLYAGSGTNGKIFTYNGSSWSESYDHPTVANINSLATYDGYLYAGTSTGGEILRLDGSAWITDYNSPEIDISSLAAYGSNLYAGSGSSGIVYAQYEAIRILGFVRIISDAVNLVEAIVSLTGIKRIIAEVVNLLLIGDSDIVLDHETGGYDQYTTAPDCGEIVTPGIASLYLSRVYATSVTPGVKTFSAPSGSYFSIRFYLDLSCYTLPDTTWHTVGIRIGDGGSNDVLWTEILNEVPDSVRISVIDDNAATTNGATIGITRTNVYLYEIFVYKAASASSLDGRIEFHLNGSLVDTIAGLDLFDQFANMTQAEIGVIDQPGMDGYIDIDEINITTETTNAIYILRTGLIKVIGEIITLIETTVRLPSTILMIVGEVTSLVSGYLTNRSMTISEVVNVPETDLGILGLIKILAETTNRAEVRQHVLGLFKVITETVNLSSGLVRLTALLRVAIETVNIGSGLVRTIGLVRVRDELIRVFETKVRPIGFVRLATETINVSEETLVRRAIAKVVSETINLISASLRWSGLVRVDSDAVSVPETTAKLSGLLRLLAEQLRLSEGTIAARGLVKVRSELIRVWSGELSVRGLVRIVVTETINLVSAVASRVGGLVKVVGEIVNVNSASIRKQGLSRVVGEVVNIVPGVVGLRGMIRSIYEQVNLVSSALSPRNLIRRTTELIRLQEVNYPVLGLVRIISSTVRVASDLLKFKGIVAIIADVINIAETVTGSPVLYTLIRLARTGVSVSDTIRGVALRATHTKGVEIDSRQTGVKSE